MSGDESAAVNLTLQTVTQTQQNERAGGGRVKARI